MEVVEHGEDCEWDEYSTDTDAQSDVFFALEGFTHTPWQHIPSISSSIGTITEPERPAVLTCHREPLVTALPDEIPINTNDEGEMVSPANQTNDNDSDTKNSPCHNTMPLCTSKPAPAPMAQEPAVLPPPSLNAAQTALADIKRVLKPLHNTGCGYKSPGLDLVLRGRLDLMKMFFVRYIELNTNAKYLIGGTWISASLDVARAAKRGPWLAWRLREWTRTYIIDCEKLPLNIYGHWNVSILEDEDLAHKIHLHLQSIGKYVKAMDIVHFLDTPAMKT